MAWRTKSQLVNDVTTNYNDNVTGDITPADLRSVEGNEIDSFQQAPVVNAQSGTSYALTVDDYGKLVVFNNVDPVTVSLPQATGSFAVWNTSVFNAGTGIVIITPAVSLIGGAATLTLASGQGQDIVSDGVNYRLTRDVGGPFVKKSGDTMSGDLTISKNNPLLILNGISGSSGILDYRRNNVERWIVQPAGAESAVDLVGSDLQFFRANNAGTFQDAPLVLRRDTGRVRLLGPPIDALDAATKQYVLDNAGGGGGTPETQRHIKQFGAVGDGFVDDTAAIQAAIDATPYGGRLRIPEGIYLVKGTGAAIFNRNTPINIWGDGAASVICTDTTVPATCDVFRFTTVGSGGSSGWSLRSFTIRGAGNAKLGRHAIFIDTPAGQGLTYNWDICDMLLLPLNGHSIHLQNADSSGGLAYSLIASNNLESIHFQDAGDGIAIVNNVITGDTHPAIFATEISGAGNMQITGNVIASTAGHIIIDSGACYIIRDNEFETQFGIPNTYGFVIDIRGNIGNVLAPLLLDNQIQVLSGTGNPVPIRINNASTAQIRGGRNSLMTGNHIVVTSFATDTLIDGGLQYVTNNVIGPPAVIDNGVRTVWNLRGKGVPTVGQVARWASTSQLEGVDAREILTADRSYYVAPATASPPGSDSNTGASGSPFLTLQKAWDTITRLDTAGFSVIVQMVDTGASPYTTGVVMNKWWVGGGSVTFQGNASTPANVLINITGAFLNAFEITDAGSGVLRVKDCKIQTNNGDAFFIKAPVTLEYSNIDFGSAGSSGCHFRAFHPGFKINCAGSYTISGSALAHWLLYYGVLEFGLPTTITVNGTLTFGPLPFAFVYLDNNAKLYVANTTFNVTGSVTGTRHVIELLCECQTGGKDQNVYFPGNALGSVKPSSVFA